MAKTNKPSKKLILSVSAVLFVIIGAFVYMSQNRTTVNCNARNGSVAHECADEYIGLSYAEASDKAQFNGLDPVLSKKDGQAQINQGFGDNHIYFETSGNTVTKAFFESQKSER